MHLEQEKLLQHNVAQLFAKELDNAFIFTQLSKQSNLGLIRGELQRLHRMVNISVHDYEMHPDKQANINDPLLNSVSKIAHDHKASDASLLTNTTIARRPAKASAGANSKSTPVTSSLKDSAVASQKTRAQSNIDSSSNKTESASNAVASEDKNASIDLSTINASLDKRSETTSVNADASLNSSGTAALVSGPVQNDAATAIASGVTADAASAIAAAVANDAANATTAAAVEAAAGVAGEAAASAIAAGVASEIAQSDGPMSDLITEEMAASTMADMSIEAALKQSTQVAEDGMTPRAQDGSRIPMDESGIQKALEQAETNYASVLEEMKQVRKNAAIEAIEAKDATAALSDVIQPVGMDVPPVFLGDAGKAALDSAQQQGANTLTESKSEEAKLLEMHLQAESYLKDSIAQDEDLDNQAGREMLRRHFAELHRLGFEAFAINIDNVDDDLFLHDTHRYMLSELRRSNNTTLFDYLLSHKGQKTDQFAVMYRDLSNAEYEQYIASYNVFTDDGSAYNNKLLKNTFQNHYCDEEDNIFATKQYADVLTAASALAKKQLSERSNELSTEKSFVHKMLPDHHLSKQGNRSFEETLVHAKEEVTVRPNGRKAAYLVSVSPLGNSKTQQLVLITDITKLHKQELILKRLIAYTLNESVEHASQSTSLQIIIMDSNYNSLAGNDMHEYLVSSISSDQLDEARKNFISQRYDRSINGYTTISYFPQADWYVVVRGGDHHNFTYLLNYLLITGLAGIVLCIIGLTIFLKRSKRDSSDLHTINTKIKHMAGLIQDSALLQRITSELPQRNDEIGTLSGNVRLMTKTLYQYTQELKRISEHKVDFKVKMQQRARIKKESAEKFEKVQQLLPENIALYSRVCDDYTGDFYDVYKINDTTTAVIVGSVNRMGMPGWEAASVNLMLLRQLLELTARNLITMGQAVTMLNKQLFDKYSGRTLSSMCAFIVDAKSGKVTFINAGHNLAVITRKDHTFEYIAVRNGSVLGLNDTDSYSSYDFTLQEGDSLLLYTDGVLDCVNHRDQKLGSHGFESILLDESFANAKDTVASIKKKIDHFCHDIKQTNDCTVLCYSHKDASRSHIDNI